MMLPLRQEITSILKVIEQYLKAAFLRRYFTRSSLDFRLIKLKLCFAASKPIVLKITAVAHGNSYTGGFTPYNFNSLLQNPV